MIFAFVGAEIATIAAAESDDPRRAVTKAMNSVVGRVLVFYVLWGYPWLTWLAIAAIVVVIGSMAFVADVRDQLWWSLGSLAVVLLAAWVHTRRRAWQPARGRRTTQPTA